MRRVCTCSSSSTFLQIWSSEMGVSGFFGWVFCCELTVLLFGIDKRWGMEDMLISGKPFGARLQDSFVS